MNRLFCCQLLFSVKYTDSHSASVLVVPWDLSVLVDFPWDLPRDLPWDLPWDLSVLASPEPEDHPGSPRTSPNMLNGSKAVPGRLQDGCCSGPKCWSRRQKSAKESVRCVNCAPFWRWWYPTRCRGGGHTDEGRRCWVGGGRLVGAAPAGQIIFFCEFFLQEIKKNISS